MEELRRALACALQQLQWSDGDFSLPMLADGWAAEGHTRHPCLLAALRASGLNRHGRGQVQRLMAAGIELRCGWPGDRQNVQSAWLGRRLCFGYAGNMHSHRRMATIVSSALGRHGERLPDWPQLLDRALQSIVAAKHRLLIVQGTSMATSVAHFATRAGLDFVLLEPPRPTQLSQWLVDALRMTTVAQPHALRRSTLISPAVDATHQASGPLQDRLAIALAETVYALAVRPTGQIQQLLDLRLRDHRFPCGSIFLALPPRLKSQTRPKQRAMQWLDRGAVGWYVPTANRGPKRDLHYCRRATSIATQQLCGPVPAHWRAAQQADWPWLVHCTRGSCGPLPEESPVGFHQRAWLAGSTGDPHPHLTLMRICDEGILKATSRITRTKQACVSLSAVPLMQLLERRQFRPHLGRWDWEPYGMIFSREALRQLGAQPVVYGSEERYASLPCERRLFFQPLGKATKAGPAGAGQPNAAWSVEREWRMPGDLDFRRLAPGTVSFFTRTQAEAQQLARLGNWPVWWIS